LIVPNNYWKWADKLNKRVKNEVENSIQSSRKSIKVTKTVLIILVLIGLLILIINYNWGLILTIPLGGVAIFIIIAIGINREYNFNSLYCQRIVNELEKLNKEEMAEYFYWCGGLDYQRIVNELEKLNKEGKAEYLYRQYLSYASRDRQYLNYVSRDKYGYVPVGIRERHIMRIDETINSLTQVLKEIEA